MFRLRKRLLGTSPKVDVWIRRVEPNQPWERVAYNVGGMTEMYTSDEEAKEIARQLIEIYGIKAIRKKQK